MLLVASLLTLEITAELLLHRWAKSGDGRYMAAGICAYVGLAVTFGVAMKTAELATVNALWQCANVALVSLYSVLVLKEKLTVKQHVGVITSLFAVYLLQ